MSIVDAFALSCLEDIHHKLHSLPELQQETQQKLKVQAEDKLNAISKAFIDLEDLVVRLLRQQIKSLLEQQEILLAEQLEGLMRDVEQKTEEMSCKLKEMQQTIRGQQTDSKKLLGKFAKGKVDQQFDLFKEQLNSTSVPTYSIDYNPDDVKDLVNDIIELLNMPQRPRSPLKTEKHASQSLIQNKSSSERINQQSVVGMNNKSSISRVITERPFEEQPLDEQGLEEKEKQSQTQSKQLEGSYFGDSAILEHQQTRSIRKKQKLDSQIKRQKASQHRVISTIAQLALEKQRLLRQLD